jgi:hypothetical protein
MPGFYENPSAFVNQKNTIFADLRRLSNGGSEFSTVQPLSLSISCAGVRF